MGLWLASEVEREAVLQDWALHHLQVASVRMKQDPQLVLENYVVLEKKKNLPRTETGDQVLLSKM